MVAVAAISNVLGTINPLEHRSLPRPIAPARWCWSTRRRACRTRKPTCRRWRRFHRFQRPQDARAHGRGRVVGPPRTARGDAAISRRRQHDQPRHHQRIRAGRTAGQVRGRHAADRRRPSGWERPSTISDAIGIEASRRPRARCSAGGLTRCWARSMACGFLGPASRTHRRHRQLHDRPHSRPRHRATARPPRNRGARRPSLRNAAAQAAGASPPAPAPASMCTTRSTKSSGWRGDRRHQAHLPPQVNRDQRQLNAAAARAAHREP